MTPSSECHNAPYFRYNKALRQTSSPITANLRNGQPLNQVYNFQRIVMEEIAFVGLLLLLGLGAYWSMVIFPRQREFQKQQKYVRSLQEGDEMITFGGIIGRVLKIDADKGIAHVEIAEGVVVRVVTASLLRPYDPDELTSSARQAAAAQD
jgi:preprotein translocase subunit YajC